jgi:hypothetical protein
MYVCVIDNATGDRDMANLRFFADLADGSALVFKRVDYDQGSNKAPRAWDETTRTWVRVTRTVNMKSNPSRHECDARCMGATGRTMNCECSCGGKNHGKGFSIVCEAA